MTIGLGLYGILVAEFSNELTIPDYPYSRRNTGRWTGSLGGKVYGGRGAGRGVALYKEFGMFGTEPHP